MCEENKVNIFFSQTIILHTKHRDKGTVVLVNTPVASHVTRFIQS